MNRHVALARLMSPFVTSCVGAFRDAYARTGMNLVQSIVLVAVGAVQWGGRKLGEDRRRRVEKLNHLEK